MPRFSAVFPRRKSTAPDELLSAEPGAPEQHSFRVLERNTFSDGRSFDGGARLSRTAGNLVQHKPHHSEVDIEENLFAGLNVNRKPWPESHDTNNIRASGASNTTKATSTDASSRHSNASTAPSSADMTTMHDDGRGGSRKPNHEPASRQSSKSSGPSLLDRAGRTFSFGIQRKHNAAPPKQEPVPDVPPLPTFQRQDEYGRTRGMTASTTSTETAPTLQEGTDMDMGGDFGSMFTSFDKRSSTATLKNDLNGGQNSAQRSGQPAHLHLDHASAVSPPLVSAESQRSGRSDEDLLGPTPAFASNRSRMLPPVPRHQASFEYRSSVGPSGEVEDNDAKLLSDSLAAGKFLTMGGPSESARSGRYHQSEEDSFTAISRKPVSPPVSSHFEKEENMFEGSVPRFARPTYRGGNQQSSMQGQNKVMTPAQFERYRLDKEREGYERAANNSPNSDDDEDDINYDDDEEDEEEKMKRQARERRDQQAQMAAYRQKMMKTTGQPARTPSPTSLSRPNLGSSLSAPHLSLSKTPSPEPVRPQEDDDEDEDVPLAILQAHGFPHKARASSRLSVANSNPNLRGTAHAQPNRPGSAMGDPPATTTQRSSTLPAFARGLPQDPFVGAGIARPAVRETLSFAGGAPSPGSLAPPPVQQPQGQPMHPGGLVGVIANEERSRAMRRGSPNLDGRGLVAGLPGSTPVDPLAAMNPNMMYGQGMPAGFPQMPQQQMMSTGDQVQLQMSQQMQQFMQMQMQFMQMMAANQNGGQQGQQQQQQQFQQQFQQQAPPPPPHHPYGGYAASQSVGDFSSGQSVTGNMMPRRLDAGMRTMSMIQPNTSSPLMPNGFGPQGHGAGSVYTPSIAPSERSNVGLPGRYRPVSQASNAFSPQLHQRSATMSGAFTSADDLKSKPNIRVVGMTKSSSDEDDDEEGWEAMRAKRDQKKSKWRFRKEADFQL